SSSLITRLHLQSKILEPVQDTAGAQAGITRLADRPATSVDDDAELARAQVAIRTDIDVGQVGPATNRAITLTEEREAGRRAAIDRDPVDTAVRNREANRLAMLVAHLASNG